MVVDMFNARALIEGATPALRLPESYDTAPLEELLRSTFNAGADAGSDVGGDGYQALITALEAIAKSTTDPVARATAERALETHAGVQEDE